MKIAVIGANAAGLGAAWSLSHHHNVVVDERHLHVDMNYHDADGLMLATSVGGRREPLPDGTAPIPRKSHNDPGRGRPNSRAGLETTAKAGKILP